MSTMQQYIFIIGKADPFGATEQAIRHAGYKVGLLSDISGAKADTSRYDRVIAADFSNVESLTQNLFEGVSVAGLLTSYENYIPAKTKIGELLGLHVPSEDAALRCTDKLLMREAFEANCPDLSPAFRFVDSVDSAKDFALQYGYPVIVKPTNLVKSLLVSRCDDELQLEQTMTSALTDISGLYEKYKVHGREPRLIVEQFLEGKLYSVAAFVDHRGEIFICPGITALKSADEAGFDDNFLYRRILPAPISQTLELRLFEAGRRGIAALDLRSSAAHIELMHTNDDEIKIIEIGARIGGYRPRMYKLSYGADMLACEIAVATGTPMPTLPENVTGYTSVYELFPREAGRFGRLVPESGVNDLSNTAQSFRLKSANGMPCGRARDGNKAVAVIIINASDPRSFEERCRKAEKIEVELL